MLLDFAKVPRHEFIDVRDGMACGNGLQGSLKICVWLDVVQLAGLDKRRDARLGSATFVMASKERVLAIEGNGANSALDDVGIHLDGAVIKEQL